MKYVDIYALYCGSLGGTYPNLLADLDLPLQVENDRLGMHGRKDISARIVANIGWQISNTP